MFLVNEVFASPAYLACGLTLDGSEVAEVTRRTGDKYQITWAVVNARGGLSSQPGSWRTRDQWKSFCGERGEQEVIDELVNASN